MARGRRFAWSIAFCGAVLLCACGGDDGGEMCSGGACGPGDQGGVGGVSGLGGASGASGLGGAGGMSGTGGSGGTAGTAMMEPPIMGPEPTACVPALEAVAPVKTMLYTGSEALEGLVLRRSELYATDATGIVRWSEGATTLARVTTATVGEVLPADLRLYWVDGASLYRVDYDGDAAMPELVASGLQTPATLLRHDEMNVFYAHAGTSSVWRQPLDGSAGVQLVMGASVKDLFVQGGSVFFASGQKIQRVEAMGGEAMDIVSDAPRTVTDIETDGIDLVWTDGVEAFAAAIDDSSSRRPLTQAGPSATGTGQSRIKVLALHGTSVYFADNAGNIGAALVNGSACRLLVERAGEVRGLAVDDDYVYVNVRAGESSELWRIEH